MNKHAQNMLLYAQDAMDYEAPWIYWEMRNPNLSNPYVDEEWERLNDHPTWRDNIEYRRIPKFWVPKTREDGWDIPVLDTDDPDFNTIYGLFRPDIDKSYLAEVDIRKFTRLLALRDELCFDEICRLEWNNDQLKDHYYIYYDHQMSKWDYGESYCKEGIEPYFTPIAAIKACQMLNEGTVTL